MPVPVSQVAEKEPRAIRPVARKGGTTRRPKIVAVGGGKGGVGKSFIVSNLGVFLGRRGERTLLVDADFGGSNLHTFLGIPAPTRGLHDFFAKRSRSLEDLIEDVGLPGVSILGGAQYYLEAANPKYAQKQRLQQILSRADVDYVVLDLGAGTAFHILDLFLFADEKIMVVSPEPTAIENVYQFLRSAFFRWIKREIPFQPVKRLVNQAVDQWNESGIRTPFDIVREATTLDPRFGEEVDRLRQRFRVKLLVNQVRNPKDSRLLKGIIQSCEKHLGIFVDALGVVPFDDSVWKSVRTRKPLVEHFSSSSSARTLESVLKQLFSAPEQPPLRLQRDA